MNFKTIIKKLAHSLKRQPKPKPIQPDAIAAPTTLNLNELPPEILSKILSYLNKYDLQNARVNRRFNELVKNPILQKNAPVPISDFNKEFITKTAHVPGRVSSIIELPDNKILCGTRSGHLCLIDVLNGRLLKKTKTPHPVACLALLPNKSIVVAADDRIRIYNQQLELVKRVRNLWGHYSIQSILALSNDRIIVGFGLFSTRACSLIVDHDTTELHCFNVRSIQRVTENTFLTLSGSNQINIYTGNHPYFSYIYLRRILRIDTPLETPGCITVLSPNEIAVGSSFGYVGIWNLDTGEHHTFNRLPTRSAVRSVSSLEKLSDDLLLVGTQFGELYSLNILNGQVTLIDEYKTQVYRAYFANAHHYDVKGKHANVKKIAHRKAEADFTTVSNIQGPYKDNVTDIDNVKGSVQNLLTLSHFNRKVVSGVTKPDSKLHIIGFGFKN